MKEAAKLGFRGAVVPPQAGVDEATCRPSEVALLADLVHRIAPAGFVEDRHKPLIGDD
jgi:predicted ATP-dependent serine protease